MGEVRAGHTLGRYELLVPIALGGMASVWAARMSSPFPKIVAVKLLRAELSDDPEFEAMFLDEATLVSQIHHPNVAETIDAGEEDGVLYQVMELIDGEPLNLVLRESKARGGMPLPIALRVVSEVCAGLHAAHELEGRDGKLVGLVHRDVSPQNILVGYEGAVKIVDFGVAKAASNLQRTSVGQVKGKSGYMSPEQASGQPVDRRSDVFALGIVFYQLVTGKHPFLADSEPATMRRIRDKAPVETARSLAPSLPVEIERIVMRALAKVKEERFTTMAEMRRAIEAAAPAAASAEELAQYMQRLLGPRGERRRAAIHEAIQIARERPSPIDDRLVLATAPRPRPPASYPGRAPSSRGARAPRSAPPGPRSAPPPARGRGRRLTPFAGLSLALGVALVIGFLVAPSIRGGDAARPTASAPAARSLRAAVQRAVHAVVASPAEGPAEAESRPMPAKRPAEAESRPMPPPEPARGGPAR